MEPREFFIEDRLEKFRLEAHCNLGESGIRNRSLHELMEDMGIDIQELGKISLADSPNQGSLELREEIAHLYRDSGRELTAENVLVTTGTSEALFLFFSLLLGKGSRVSLFTPAFQALYEIPMQLGAEIHGVSIHDKRLDVSRLWENDPDLVILNHPHNPTGQGLLREDWNALAEIANKTKSRILFDEHYRFLDGERDLTPTGVGLSKNCYATGSITKCFGVVGLKIGWLVGEKSLIDRARSFKDYLTHTVNPISEYLCLQVLKNRHKLIKPIKSRIRENISYFCENLSGLGSIIDFYKPDGGLVGFSRLCPGLDSEKYADALYENASVFVLPGSNFEREGYIRIGFGEEEVRFREGIDRWIEWEKQGKAE